MLKTTLVSCTQQPADDPRPAVVAPPDVPSIPSVSREASLGDNARVRVTSDFSDDLRVVVSNAGPAPIFLTPNFNATSRIRLYDVAGRSLFDAGFEGRPPRGSYREIAANTSFAYDFDIPVDPDRTAGIERACAIIEWSDSPDERGHVRREYCVSKPE